MSDLADLPVEAKCPICGQPNGCRMATTSAYKGPCWCEREKIPRELLELVPEDLRRKACICKSCVTEFHHQAVRKKSAPIPQAGDFYLENGYIVFTAHYLLRRGYCCGNGCRHCPYEKPVGNF